ncbi:hypothetical protein DPMN_182743 [Dreissena polymorpha]|uniref:Uncharacterized protein n=1 Tax=Dreissena polymorpha TaxID=45954 RepID=A0A9D4DGW1_DREPO|nr:hypothetical protein DPMN_182743 [Dreissena polymorpha]
MVLRNSVIKGYHFFQIRPPNTTPPTQLLVQPEYTNIHDECASLVWLPELDTFPDHMHSLITDEKRQLKLKNVAGLPIGHVPRNLAGFFRPLMESGCIVAERCNYIITHSDIEAQYNKLSELLKSIPEGTAMELVLL